MFLKSSLVIFCVIVAVVSKNVSRVVNIEQGPVRGYKYEGDGFYSFYEIPFATIKERFQPAVSPEPWTETFEAVKKGIICPQAEVVYVDLSDKIMQEDCLVMNIFVPDTEQENLPVMVDIHGGAYYSGLGNAHRFTDFAALNNVIVVTFNYRIGLLGFLCLGTEKIPGNAGMKDQITALRWVKRNIATFGGDPDDITVTGCSAGGSSVDLLLVSRMSEGLFNRAIPDSGSNLGSFTVQFDPIANSKQIAQNFNFTNFNSLEQLENFFLNISVETILTRPNIKRPDGLVEYAPCIERDVGQQMFLHDAPYNILKSGNFTRYPTMYGLTNKEGLMSLGDFNPWIDLMNEDFSAFLPGDLKFESVDEMKEIAEAVKKFYFGNKPIDSNMDMNFVDFQTDTLFVYSMLRNIQLQIAAGDTNIYLYEYSYYEDDSKFQGATHCRQTRAVRDETDDGFSQEYINIKRLLRQAWINFIKTNNPVLDSSPVPSWPNVNKYGSPHLSVGKNIELRGPLIKKKFSFWNSIYEKHYKTPQPPRTFTLNSEAKNSA